MRIAYLDCFAGIAGDMFLGALVGAGVPTEVLDGAVTALDLGASLQIETVDRSGISSIKVHVLEKGVLAEAGGGAESHQDPAPVHSHQPETQHQHKIGHTHTHDGGHTHDGEDKHSHHHDQDHEHGHKHEAGHQHEHGHKHEAGHGRSLTVIRDLIARAPLAEPVKALSIKAFELLGHAEAKIHNVPVEQIHFHEVGAVDAIVDIVASCAGIHHLAIGKWYSSDVNVGGGMVECAHGTFPVPAPATADLLRGVPTYAAHLKKELVTPTGAALLRALEPVFSDQPRMRTEAIGYGAGTRNPKDFPNVLRLTVGKAATASASSTEAPAAVDASPAPAARSGMETVTILETALDDASPQVLAYVAEKVLASGALDVMLTPVIMKKGRPGTLITVLAEPATSDAFEDLLLRETGTLGVRRRVEQRACLDRRHQTVQTAYGPIRVKVGAEGGEERHAAPEYEDCRRAAAEHNAPLKHVQGAALAAYRQTT